MIRYGHLHVIKVVGRELVFRFEEKGRFTRAIVNEFAQRLGMSEWKFNRTHWAVDGGIPSAMLAKVMPSFDVVFPFAGENREYVRKVAQYLHKRNVSIFYDGKRASASLGKRPG